MQGVIDGVGRIVVADEAVTMPRPTAGLEIRADGLWASFICETPFEHWSLGLEAFGLRLDEDAGALEAVPSWSDLVGERIPVGFDLEWELRGPPEDLLDCVGYRQPGTTFGDVLVDRGRVAIDAPSWREHSWAT